MNRTWLRAQSKIHSTIYRITNGRIGSNFGAPVLLLTTIGRKSGQPRTSPLFYVADNYITDSYVTDGAQWAVVASNAGSDHHPNCWYNLQANPAAQVQLADCRYDVTARVASAEEHNRLWPQFIELFAGYDTYQKMTKRELPLVILVGSLKAA